MLLWLRSAVGPGNVRLCLRLLAACCHLLGCHCGALVTSERELGTGINRWHQAVSLTVWAERQCSEQCARCLAAARARRLLAGWHLAWTDASMTVPSPHLIDAKHFQNTRSLSVTPSLMIVVLVAGPTHPYTRLYFLWCGCCCAHARPLPPLSLTHTHAPPPTTTQRSSYFQ